MNLVVLEGNYRILAIFLIGTILALSFLGMFMGMNIGKGGNMGNCPFTTGMSVCTMDFYEHLAAWQNVFNATPRSFYVLNIVLSLIVIFPLVFYSLLGDMGNDLLSVKERPRFIFETYFPRNSLQEEFSQGILNTKVY